MSSCAVDMTMDFKENDTLDIILDMKMDKAELEESGLPMDDLTCEAMFADMQEDPEMRDMQTEDLSEGSVMHCRMITADQPLSEIDSDNMTVTNEGGIYTVVSEGEPAAEEIDMNAEGADQIEFSMNYRFPGEVIESDIGEVNGNTVTITDPNEVSNPHTITAYSTAAGAGAAAGGGNAQDNAGENTATENNAPAQTNDGGGLGILPLVLLGLLGLAIIGLVVWLILRKKDDGAGPSGPGYAPQTQQGHPQQGQVYPGQQPGQQHPGQYQPGQQQGQGYPGQGYSEGQPGQGYQQGQPPQGHPQSQQPGQAGYPQQGQPGQDDLSFEPKTHPFQAQPGRGEYDPRQEQTPDPLDPSQHDPMNKNPDDPDYRPEGGGQA